MSQKSASASSQNSDYKPSSRPMNNFGEIKPCSSQSPPSSPSKSRQQPLHISSSHNYPSSRRSKHDNAGRNYACKFCNRSYLSYPALWLHTRNKHAREYEKEGMGGDGKGRRGRPRGKASARNARTN